MSGLERRPQPAGVTEFEESGVELAGCSVIADIQGRTVAGAGQQRPQHVSAQPFVEARVSSEYAPQSIDERRGHQLLSGDFQALASRDCRRDGRQKEESLELQQNGAKLIGREWLAIRSTVRVRKVGDGVSTLRIEIAAENAQPFYLELGVHELVHNLPLLDLKHCGRNSVHFLGSRPLDRSRLTASHLQSSFLFTIINLHHIPQVVK